MEDGEVAIAWSGRSLDGAQNRARLLVQAKTMWRKAAEELVGLGRLELPTSPLSGVRSSHLSYRPNGIAEEKIYNRFSLHVFSRDFN